MPPNATRPQPQYLVTLSDGVSTIGLAVPSKTGLRRLPRGTGVERKTARQSTWDGGRANDRFPQDTSRFYDAGNAWTMVPDQVCSGPMFQITPDDRKHNVALTPTAGGNGFEWVTPGVPDAYYARSFVAPAGGYTTINVRVVLRHGSGAFSWPAVQIRADNAGEPAASTLWSQTLSGFSADTLGVISTRTNITLTLTAGTTYWIVVLSHTTVQVGVDRGASGKYSTTGGAGSWSTVAYAPLFHVYAYGADWRSDAAFFFEYKRQLYFVGCRTDSSVSVLLINGDRGVSTSGAAKAINDTTKAWAVNVWAGAVAVIVGGPGYGRYSRITSNTPTQLVLEDFVYAGTGSEYVIIGSDVWTAVGSTGFNSVVTSVAMLNDIVYFALGDDASTPIRRMREYNNAGTWTREFAADGTNTAQLVLSAPHWNDGTASLYRSKATASNVAVAKQAAWGVNLTFETAMDVGTKESRITGLCLYNNSVWAGKEDSIWTLKGGKFGDVPIAMRAARDERNGRTILGWNTNLFLSFMSGLERLYGQVVDDIGPDREAGMPTGRRGAVTAAVPVIQYLFCAYDAGASATTPGWSSVLATTTPGGDWHELFRALESGQRIGTVFHQAVPGKTNRLWVQHGRDLGYLHLPDDVHNPINDSYMRYAWESYVTSSWFDYDTVELQKFFDQVRVMTRSLDAYHKIRIDYKVDTDDDPGATNPWIAFPTEITSSPYTILNIGNHAVVGKRIRFRVVFVSSTNKAAVLNSFEVRANQMNEIKYDLVIDANLQDSVMLMSGEDSPTTSLTVLNVLESWKEYATPLTLRCAMPGAATIFDNIRGHIEPVSWSTGAWDEIDTAMNGSISFVML